MRGIAPSFSENKKTSLRIYFSQFHLAKSAEYRPSYGWNVSAAKTCATFPLSFCHSARNNSLGCREAVRTICFSVPALHTFSS